MSLPRFWIALLIAALLIPAAGHAPQAARPGLQASPCTFTLPQGEREGSTVVCATLSVPEAYENPGGATIELAVVVIKSLSSNPRPDPIFFAQGGPGGSTIEYFTQVLFDSPLRNRRDLVLFDQRGTLNSSPALLCPEFLDETIKVLDEELTIEQENLIYRQAADNCHARLVSEGINLSAFNSYENAQDVDTLRQALGYQKINFYGVSYGTLLGLHLMKAFPDGLRSVILDAVVPTNIDFNPESARTADRALTELFSACQADPECSRAYPNLEKTFFDLIDRLDKQPAAIHLSDSEKGATYKALLDGDAMISTVFQSLYATELLPLLPKMIADASAGRWTLVERVQSLVTFDRTIAEGMYYSVICSEDADFDPAKIDYTGIRPRLLKDERANNEALIQVCKDWNVAQLGPAADEPVVSDVPALLLNGRFDPITPESYGRLAAQTLSHSYVFTFPNTGHGAFGDDCADRIMADFIDNPSQKPDSSCIEQARIDFVTPKDVVDFPVLIKALNLEPNALVQFGLAALLGLVLLTAWLVYPVAWLARVMGGRAGRPTPIYGHLAPWAAMLAGLFVLAFGVALAVVSVLLVRDNNVLVLFGIPAAYRWIFIFPLIAGLLSLAMAALAAAGWRGTYWPGWRKVYYTLLALAAVGCTLLFGVTGALWGLIG